MVIFNYIKPTRHYLENHSDFPWNEVIEILLTTKNPKKKGNNYEIIRNNHYILFKIENSVLYVINAKK